MSPDPRPRFPHRQNQDGSYDSICTTCLLTVASAWNEKDLACHEATHICDPVRVYQASYGTTLTKQRLVDQIETR